MSRQLILTIAAGVCLVTAVAAQPPGKSATQPLAGSAAKTPPVDRRAGEAGLPFITWFSQDDYGGTQQTWSFAQDSRGILYAGDSAGILEYDGASWRRIPTPHNSVVRAMAAGPDGRVFAGEVRDFGYLRPGKNGEMKFTSLLKFVPAEDRDFQDVQSAVSTPEGVYFLTSARLFRLTPEGSGWRAKVWKPATVFGKLLRVFGTLYVTAGSDGLLRMDGDRLEKVSIPGLPNPGVAENRVASLLPYAAESGQMLMATRGGRLFLLDDAGTRPFATGAGPLLQKFGVSTGSLLRDGAVGIGTRNGGFVVLERDGRLRRYVDHAAGIPSDGVMGVYVDPAGTVWLGLQNGIAKVEASSPLSEFPAAAGLSAAVNDIKRYQGVLYAATIAGLRKLDGTTGQFQTVPAVGLISVFGLLPHGNALLVAGEDKLFQVTGTNVRQLVQFSGATSAMVLAQSRQDANRVWIGTTDGLAAMRQEPSGRWLYEGPVAATPQVRSIVEPEPGLLWLGTQSEGIIRIRLAGDSLRAASVERFGKAQGLPTDGGVTAHLAAGRVVFSSPEGVREFDSSTGRFVESKIFGGIPTAGSCEEHNIVSDRQGNLWVNFEVFPVFLKRRSDGTYQADSSQLQRIGAGRVIWLFLDDDGVLWMGGGDRVYRYDPAKAQTGRAQFSTLLRRVTAGDRDRTVLYAGGGGDALRTQPAIAFKANALRFEYTAASFENPSKNQFQTILEGFDDDWSAWTTETRRDYTNLPPGKYRFRVRAMNALMQPGSAEAEYRFEILPPWHRTWWAYGLYALLLALAGYALARIVRWRATAREQARSKAKMLQAEIERKRNVELLSEMGKELTSSLDIDTIFVKLHESVNQLMDAAVFGVGIYHPSEHAIEYRLAIESGKRYQPYRRDTRDKNQFPVWCIEHREPVFVNDVAAEYSRYIEKYEDSASKLEDGSISQTPQSLIYLPLIAKDQVLGILSVQSFKKNAYTEYHLNLLENLAAYTSIALDNADAYQHLKSAQEQLVVQEKLASLGALTAGIAHEIKNPLNFVNNFADLSVELMAELREELEMQKASIPAAEYGNIALLLDDLTSNAKKINEHGRRADAIVRSMLQHSRGQAGEHQPTDINAMLDEYVNLAYHGMRAQDASFNVTIEREFDAGAGMVDAVPQDISRVFLNILNNACYAANEKARKAGAGFAPTLIVRTVNLGDAVEVRIRDNGMGIPADVRDSIFNPFFTTKPTGQGTGLGLSISHDIIVQEHGGQLEVETEPGEFTEFVVRLPRQWRKAA
jgi:signal transduction histidine kinase/ligand-binding sensor domain-containing protein